MGEDINQRAADNKILFDLTGHKAGTAKTNAKGTVGTGSGKVTSGGAMAPATAR